MPLDDVSRGSGDVRIAIDLPNTPELIEINSGDKEPED